MGEWIAEAACMLASRTLSISIAKEWRQTYETIWPPQAFTRWASGLTQSKLEFDGEGWWKGEGPEGAIRIRFSEQNGFGVMDHQVSLANGDEIYVPMRVVPNAEGAEVLFTLFRQPGMTDEKFLADAAWVERDLRALKSMLENSG
jgi:hypothetical protein